MCSSEVATWARNVSVRADCRSLRGIPWGEGLDHSGESDRPGLLRGLEMGFDEDRH